MVLLTTKNATKIASEILTKAPERTDMTVR